MTPIGMMRPMIRGAIGQRCAAAQQAARADEADERARGKGATTEAEDVDLVGWGERAFVLVVLNQPVVRGADVRLEPEAETAAGETIERTSADAFEIELELSHRVVANAALMAFGCQREMVEDVGAIVLVVPGAIEAHHQASNLCHDCSG